MKTPHFQGTLGVGQQIVDQLQNCSKDDEVELALGQPPRRDFVSQIQSSEASVHFH